MTGLTLLTRHAIDEGNHNKTPSYPIQLPTGARYYKTMVNQFSEDLNSELVQYSSHGFQFVSQMVRNSNSR